MLDISPELKVKLDARATTFCHCWRLARGDGQVLGFTDHDCDLSFNGVTFLANTGLTASQSDSAVGFSSGKGEADGALSSDSLTETDLVNGRYDNACVETWLVDWTNIEDRLLLDVATIGEVRRGEFSFSAELRSSAHLFDQTQGKSYQRCCTANIGDAACGLDLSLGRYQTGGVINSASGGVVSITADSGFASGFLAGGRLTFRSGSNAGGVLEIKSHRQHGLRSELTFWAPPSADDIVGCSVELTAGCDKSPETCRDKFANIVNFRGFPHMPGNDKVVSYPSSRSAAMDGGSFFR